MKSRVRKNVSAAAVVLSVSVLASLVAVAPVGAAARAVSKVQRGLDTFVTDACQSSASWSSLATAQFKAFKSIGANSVGISFPLYTDSLTSNTIYANDECAGPQQTPSAARLGILVGIAHKVGLKVLLRPILDESVLRAENPNYWRGIINPTNVNTWFNNYLTTLRPYLQMAQADHVEHFAVSTELDSMASLSNWGSAIALAKALYKGDLDFTLLWEDGVVSKRWSGTSSGLDTYQYVTGKPNNASPAQLLQSWNYALSTKAKLAYSIKSATIQEVGIPAQDGAAAQPFAWGLPLSSHPFNQIVQSNWYTMACSFYKTHKMQGIYYWGAYLDQGAGALLKAPDSATTLAIQPKSVASIKKCFTGR